MATRFVLFCIHSHSSSPSVLIFPRQAVVGVLLRVLGGNYAHSQSGALATLGTTLLMHGFADQPVWPVEFVQAYLGMCMFSLDQSYVRIFQP